MRRLVTVLVLGLVSMFGFASVAMADPVNNPNAVVLAVDCEGEEAVEVVVTGEAGHVLGDPRIGVLQGATIRTFVNDVLVNEETFVRGKGLKDLTPCKWEHQFTDSETGASIRVEVDAQVLITPQSR